MFNIQMQSYYMIIMQGNFQLIILIWMVVEAMGAVEPYNYMGSSVSGVKQLYMNSTALPQNSVKSFTITYAAAKNSNLKIIFGLAGYEEHSDMSISYFKLSQGLNTPSQFAVNVMAAGTSQVYMISLSYIALEDTTTAFYIRPVDYNDFSFVDTGSGSRAQNIPTNFFTFSGISNYTLSYAFAFLIGFQIKSSSGKFNLYVRVALNSNITFTTTITTNGGCKIEYVQIMHFFIDKTKFSNPALFVDSQIYDLTQSNQSIVPSHYTSFGYGMLGLLGWEGRVPSNNTNISFNQIVSNYDLTVILSTNSLDNVQFQHIFLAYNQCPPLFPYYENSTKLACVAQCKTQQSLSPTSGICNSCTSPCQECFGLATNCTACISGYDLTANNCTEKVTSTGSTNRLYLLGLLGIIPLIFLILCYCLFRRKTYKIQDIDFAMQPSIDIT